MPGLTSLLCEDMARLEDVVRRLDAGAARALDDDDDDAELHVLGCRLTY